MKTSRPFHSAAMAVALFTVLPQESHACACCSDPGEYSLRTAKISEFQLGHLEAIVFGPEAELFMTDAGEEDVKGVSSVADSYAVTAKFTKKQWVLKFRMEGGKTGTLTLTIPEKLTDFDVDIHDGQKSGGGGPLLYKEWRLEGAAVGDGIFQKGKVRYSLVFQGRGNRCDDRSDFTHWRLAITGKNIDYSLGGELVPEKADPAKPEPEAEPKKDGQ